MLVAGVSKKGGRKENEDCYGEAMSGGILCAVVADGLGGHSGGEIASKLAVDTVIKAFLASPGFSEKTILEYINKANEEIVDVAKTEPEYVHMSSTIVVLLKKGSKAIWANAGDSRIYKFRNGRITDVSEDQSLAFVEFMNGDIEYGDIRTSQNQNRLTNALGMQLGRINVSEVFSVDIDTSFLLCTDGWWEYVPEDIMENTLLISSNTHDWLKGMLDIIEGKAPKDNDNYTALAVMV